MALLVSLVARGCSTLCLLVPLLDTDGAVAGSGTVVQLEIMGLKKLTLCSPPGHGEIWRSRCMGIVEDTMGKGECRRGLWGYK